MREPYYVQDWILHPTFDDILVSDYGTILSYKNRSWRELHQSDNGSGYLRVGIGHSNPQYIHRLVAQTFIPNPDPLNLVQVNHKDGDKYNNYVENLEWVTALQNNKHAWKLGLKQNPKGRAIRIVETGQVYQSIAECARQINGIQGNIAWCLLGARKTHRGYSFEYVDGDR